MTVIEAINLLMESNKNTLDEEKIEGYQAVINELEETGNRDWKIVDYKNDNNKGQSGYYASSLTQVTDIAFLFVEVKIFLIRKAIQNSGNSGLVINKFNKHY